MLPEILAVSIKTQFDALQTKSKCSFKFPMLMLNDSKLHKPMLGFVAWYCLTVGKKKKKCFAESFKTCKNLPASLVSQHKAGEPIWESVLRNQQSSGEKRSCADLVPRSKKSAPSAGPTFMETGLLSRNKEMIYYLETFLVWRMWQLNISAAPTPVLSTLIDLKVKEEGERK